jgi:hypothetical protein
LPKPALILCDFDRTLFDTDQFFLEIWQLAGKMYEIDDEWERSQAPDFFTKYGDAYDYRFFEHLKRAAGQQLSIPHFINEARKAFSDKFLYDDATNHVITMIDEIVTFGGTEYQTFKLGLCPSLDAIPRRIILEPKGEYITKNYTQPTILVDDKLLEGTLQFPARFIRIDRSLASENSSIGIITSLSDLPRAIAATD